MLKMFLFSVTVFGLLLVAGGDSRANQWAAGEPVMVPCLGLHEYHELQIELERLDCSNYVDDCEESRQMSASILKEYFGFDEVVFAQPRLIWEGRRTKIEADWAKRVAMNLEWILPMHTSIFNEWRNLKGYPVQFNFSSEQLMPVWRDAIPRYRHVIRFDSQAIGLKVETKYGKGKDGVPIVMLTLTVGAPHDPDRPIPFGSFRDLMVFMANHGRN